MKLKKALAVLLSLIMISSVGCKNKTKKDDAVINVWTATGTEKILQDYKADQGSEDQQTCRAETP